MRYYIVGSILYKTYKGKKAMKKLFPSCIEVADYYLHAGYVNEWLRPIDKLIYKLIG